MIDDKERLKIAQWVLERNLAWISAAEVKVGVIVAINTAMLGGVGAAFSSSDVVTRTAWAYVWTVGSALALASSLFCAAMTVLPRVNGPLKSLVFFGRISKLDQAEYVAKFRVATDEKLLEDTLAQVHRNAEIACAKFSWVQVSIRWSFLSILPWFLAIITLLKR